MGGKTGGKVAGVKEWEGSEEVEVESVVREGEDGGGDGEGGGKAILEFSRLGLCEYGEEGEGVPDRGGEQLGGGERGEGEHEDAGEREVEEGEAIGGGKATLVFIELSRIILFECERDTNRVKVG